LLARAHEPRFEIIHRQRTSQPESLYLVIHALATNPAAPRSTSSAVTVRFELLASDRIALAIAPSLAEWMSRRCLLLSAIKTALGPAAMWAFFR
jgi:hypothetical protein